jgi:serine/threonine protein kinase/formylglycine-generating enzyme required for sulfatase activity
VSNDHLPSTKAFNEAGTNRPRDGDTLSSDTEPAETELVPAVLRALTRFEVRQRLGRGSFGEVYLAFDHHLERLVAIKVPRADRFSATHDLDGFLREARAVAALRHSGIVTVHDVHNDDNGSFIVLEFVEGQTLAGYAESQQLSFDECARLMVSVAEAVAYAHQHGIVHRDLKPSNILVDAHGNIRIADFGLAIRELGQRQLARETAGTPNFMAPEQIRGETHRLDGRTDIWSLGVIFYWMLTGRRPFDGPSPQEVFDEVLHSDPRPPRQVAADVPRELERICLKAMSKRMSDRYGIAGDMAEDLSCWLTTHSPQSVTPQKVVGQANGLETQPDSPERPFPAPVIPKGLRSFDKHDADFFCSLLPGPHDRLGVPECVRFWRQRIEDDDLESTFAVGLMYGPSGCGKTSLMRAGVLPMLNEQVRRIYVESESEDNRAGKTEFKILNTLRREFPHLPTDRTLIESIVELREGNILETGDKLFLVIDQFEQWLSGRDINADQPLVRALRHFDGGRLQCLLMVRDDFCMAATRFMNALEVPILEGHNCAAIDVFHPAHARSVLRRFGEAFGRWSPNNADNERFVEQAVDLLTQDGAVVPVRLAAFAELARHQEWKPSTLRPFGGPHGLGVALVDFYLGEENIQPTHRKYREAARQVLRALLPDDRTSLKGPMRSHTELMVASGYANQPEEFSGLLTMLDKELRLISPADPHLREGTESPGDSQPAQPERLARPEPCFQLSHDYLVPAIDAWLTAKQRETYAGRAALLLETISADWHARPHVRRLPTAFEWIAILRHTRRGTWTSAQQKMMAAASRRQLGRIGAIVLGVLLVVGALALVRQRNERLTRDDEARATARQLLVADMVRVPSLLSELDNSRNAAANALLQEVADSTESSEGDRLRAQLFLADTSDAASESLLPSLLSVRPTDHRIIVARLHAHAATAKAGLWKQMSQIANDGQLLGAAAALAVIDPQNSQWSVDGPRVAVALARCQNRDDVSDWADILVPIKPHLTPTLRERFRNHRSPIAERWAAVCALTQFYKNEFSELAALAVNSPPEAFPVAMEALQANVDVASKALAGYCQTEDEVLDVNDRVERARQHAMAAIALAQIGVDGPYWNSLGKGASATVRTFVIDHSIGLGMRPRSLLARLNSDRDDPFVRQAALVALGEYGSRLSSTDQGELLGIALRLFDEDPDPGVHAAAEYVLRRLDKNDALTNTRGRLAGKPSRSKQWMINGQGMTFVVVSGRQQFAQGSPNSEEGREQFEEQRPVAIEHSFAISSHEVTREQFQRSRQQCRFDPNVAPTDNCPIHYVSWYDAMKYCRWLSEEEGIPNEEMCYPPADEIDENVILPSNWQQRAGYRLPTEAEWECACRAGVSTKRFYGENEGTLDLYAAYAANSRGLLAPVGSFRPNPWGLFDVYGNVFEWCQDGTNERAADSTEPDTSPHRAVRSGSYRSLDRENRSAKRWSYTPGTGLSFLGMRVVRTIRNEAPPSLGKQ